VLQHVDPFYDASSFPAYLFQAPGDWRIAEFQAIEWELLQLNNFFCGFQEIASECVASLQNEIEAKRPRSEWVVESDSSRHRWMDTPAIIPIYHHQLPLWQEIADFVTPATQFLLLYVLCEKSLKDLCVLYSLDWRVVLQGDRYQLLIEHGSRNRIKKRDHESMLTAYLRVLREHCNLSFVCPESTELLDGEIRRVRNSFGHGDWKQVVECVKDMRVVNAFEAFRDLFTVLVEARLSSLPPESDAIPF
jgi:hypothetical protein